MRILIVDDHEENADSLAIVLRLLGHEVKIARSIDEGKAILGQGRLDAAVIDWHLSPATVDGGGDLMAWARGAGIMVPFVLLTGSVEVKTSTMEGLGLLEDVAVLHKPCDPEAMMTALEVMARGRKLVEAEPGKPDSWFDPNPL